MDVDYNGDTTQFGTLHGYSKPGSRTVFITRESSARLPGAHYIREKKDEREYTQFYMREDVLGGVVAFGHEHTVDNSEYVGLSILE